MLLALLARWHPRVGDQAVHIGAQLLEGFRQTGGLLALASGQRNVVGVQFANVLQGVAQGHFHAHASVVVIGENFVEVVGAHVSASFLELIKNLSLLSEYFITIEYKCQTGFFVNVLMEKFGEKVRTLRKRRKMSQQRLATVLGIQSSAFISELETGKRKPSLEFVLKIAELFDVTPNHLLLDDIELDA